MWFVEQQLATLGLQKSQAGRRLALCMFWQVRVSQEELSQSEEGDVLLADPPSPGGSCGGIDGTSSGGEGKQYVNCPAGRGGGCFKCWSVFHFESSLN